MAVHRLKHGVYARKTQATDIVVLKLIGLQIMDAASCEAKGVLYRKFNDPESGSFVMTEHRFRKTYSFIGRFITRTTSVETLIPKRAR
jgi:hypothetical protein